MLCMRYLLPFEFHSRVFNLFLVKIIISYSLLLFVTLLLLVYYVAICQISDLYQVSPDILCFSYSPVYGRIVRLFGTLFVFFILK